MKVLIVLDIGTSNTKGLLFNNKGAIIYQKTKKTPPEHVKSDKVEQSPDIWLDIIIDILINIAAIINKNKYSLEGITIAGQRSSLIVLDENYKPINKAIMWQDKRSESIVEKLKSKNKYVFDKTGANLNSVYLAPKIKWVNENCRSNKKIHKYLTIIDYIAFFLTGKFKTDLTYGSRTSMMNIHTKKWDNDLLNIFNVDQKQLCQLVEPGSVVGYITDEVIKKTGFKKTVPLISSGGDQQCGAVGLGILNAGNVGLNMGTGAYLTSITNKIPDNLENDITLNCYSISNKYMLETTLLNCSSLLDWFSDNFYGELNPQHVYKKIEDDLLASSDGANGVVFLPYFQGRGTPDWNDSAKGSFLNLTLANKRSDMLRAIIEGIGLEILNHLDILNNYVETEHQNIYLSGGLSNSNLIVQNVSNITSKVIKVYSNSEATAIGAFIIASNTIGFFENFNEALENVRSNDAIQTYYPDRKKQCFYRELQETHNLYYESMKR